MVTTRSLCKDTERHPNKVIQSFLPLKQSLRCIRLKSCIIFVVVTDRKDNSRAQANQTVYGRLRPEKHKRASGQKAMRMFLKHRVYILSVTTTETMPHSRIKKFGQFKSFLGKRLTAMGDLMGRSSQAKWRLSLWDDGLRMCKHSE